MSPELNAELEDLLSRWHSWQKGDRGVRGFNGRALLIGDTRAMKVQYEAQIERQDEEHDALRCRQVDHEVMQMDDPHRTAIFFLARNLSTGSEVWISPRLPIDRVGRALVVTGAKAVLAKRLIMSGVLDCFA